MNFHIVAKAIQIVLELFIRIMFTKRE